MSGIAATFGAPAAAAHRLERVDFSAIAGFRDDDLLAAFEVFRRHCVSILQNEPELRRGQPPDEALRTLCRRAQTRVEDRAAAASFFETHFAPWRIVPVDAAGRDLRGFLTGYYEPDVEASLVPTVDFATPILGRPADLVTLQPGEDRDALAGLSAARRREDGRLEPYPDRAAIETGALGAAARPVAWVRDRIERFMMQVQGSARLRFPAGRSARLTYAGRNGWPYTSIGRALVEEGRVSATDMSLERLKAWIRAAGQDDEDEGAALMRRNRSFVFFRLDEMPDPAVGPTGAAGLPLTKLRSIAVDRTLWSYGLPFWISAELPWKADAPTDFRRLMIAQDTGSAIVGPARVDLFFGSGDEAGKRAGAIRHAGDVIVFLPAEAQP